jgi:hypothetical protein
MAEGQADKRKKEGADQTREMNQDSLHADQMLKVERGSQHFLVRPFIDDA